MEKMENIANDKNWKALIKPSKIDVKTHENKSIATITAEPLEKGYGLTIGNSCSISDGIISGNRSVCFDMYCQFIIV